MVKKYLCSLLLIVMPLIAQSPVGDVELVIQQFNDPYPSTQVFWTLEKMGTPVCHNLPSSGSDCPGGDTNDHDDQSFELAGERYCISNGFAYYSCGEEMLAEPGIDCALNNSEDGTTYPFTNGLYKISAGAWIGLDFISSIVYFDNRNCDYISSLACGDCGGNDVTIRYDIDNNEFWYMRGNSTTDPSLNGFTQIQQEGVINWWEEAGPNCPACFTNFDIRPFPQLVLTVVPPNDHPRLNWSPLANWPLSGVNFVSYEIQRSQASSGFHTIHTELSETNRVFTDYSVVMNTTPSVPIQYMIKVNFDDGSSEFSNVQKGDGTKQGQGSLIVGSDDPVLPSKIELFQNHPNPFNPTTTISFVIPKDGQVSLKIYNSNGQEVSEVINEFRSTGLHSITFDASGLAAGTYFYKLKSGKFSDIKKFTVVK